MAITQDLELDGICRAKTGVGVEWDRQNLIVVGVGVDLDWKILMAVGVGVELDRQNLIVVGVGVELKWSIPGVAHL